MCAERKENISSGNQVYAHKSDLEFQIEDDPTWRARRDASDPKSSREHSFTSQSTAKMLEDITRFASRFYNPEVTPPKARSFAEHEFACAMAINFVYHSNIGESIASKSRQGTKEVLTEYLEKGSRPHERGIIETIQTYEALSFLQDLPKDQGSEKGLEPGWLTVPLIQEAHTKLLVDIHEDAGKVRERPAYTVYKDEDYYHPMPDKLSALFYACIDHHNMHIEGLNISHLHKVLCNREFDENPHDLDDLCHKFRKVFQSAAWLMFQFVDVHPFGDGNGRMCRLLANYVLSIITPFPVPIYLQVGDTPDTITRDDYLDAIVHCRKSASKQPGLLAAMLVENAWLGWRKLFRQLKALDLLSNITKLGPVVLKCDRMKREQAKDEIHTKLSLLNFSLNGDEIKLIAMEVKVCVDNMMHSGALDSLVHGTYLSHNVMLKCLPKHEIELHLY